MVGNLAEIRKKSIGPSWGENDKREKVVLMMRDSDWKTSRFWYLQWSREHLGRAWWGAEPPLSSAERCRSPWSWRRLGEPGLEWLDWIIEKHDWLRLISESFGILMEKSPHLSQSPSGWPGPSPWRTSCWSGWPQCPQWCSWTSCPSTWPSPHHLGHDGDDIGRAAHNL